MLKNIHIFRIRLITILLLLSQLAIAHVDAADREKPNVILIMADDLGYCDLSCYGSDTIRTPKLDQMAREGMRLTSFYAGCTVCTPSRMALLTGAYPTRVGWPGGVMGYKIDWSNGLTPDALTIAEVFRDAGYATGICGKWHLGNSAEMQPTNQGFESAYYIKSSNNQTKQLWFDDVLVQDPFDNRLLTEQFTEKAISFIQANKAKPFFLYIPFTAPHFPAQAHPDWKGKSQLGAYGDVVEELDHRVGQILQALLDYKLDKTTIVIFTSDNGPEPGQKQWARSNPYRGLKWSSLEGGNRVPCLVRWPGMIPSGRVSDEIIAAIDWLPTLTNACQITRTANTTSPKIDGVNVWDTLIAKPDSRHAREDLLFWNGWGVAQAIRVGDWKLYFDNVNEIPESSKGPVLFDLAKDPHEQTNLASQYPEKVLAMMKLAVKQLADIESNAMALGGPVPDQSESKKRGVWLK